jgi:hypothetical protein
MRFRGLKAIRLQNPQKRGCSLVHSNLPPVQVRYSPEKKRHEPHGKRLRMTVVNTRTLIIPVWLLTSALVAALTAPSGIEATGLLLVISGLAVLVSLLGKAATPVFDGVPVMRALPPPEPSAARLLSWPNSGFRNITRGTKGG